MTDRRWTIIRVISWITFRIETGIRRTTVPAAALVLALVIAVGLGIWFGLDWKVLIGWKALISYINPQDATDRKDAVQVYALMVAGVVAAITATAGLLNLRLTRRNLEQQRELEAQRGQGTALQAYYEQIGKLITDTDLLNTERKEIRELARGQTLTVLQEIDGRGKGSLLTFLHGAGLIEAENPTVKLSAADLRYADLQRANLNGAGLQEASLQEANLLGASLRGANLQGANLQGAKLYRADLNGASLKEANLKEADLQRANLPANLSRANLQGANLQGANLLGTGLKEADLQEATLYRANLQGASLKEANLQGAKVTEEQLAAALYLQGTIMPDGQKYEDWLKSED